MGVKLKKSVKPIGSHVIVRIKTGLAITWHRYQVIEVTGDEDNVPNQGPPIIWMELAEKTLKPQQSFISLPLSVFDQRVVIAEGEEQFWEITKTPA